MDYFKLIAKSEVKFQKQILTVKTLAMIFIWTLDWKNVLRLHLRKGN
jgi:hypothetical protein